MVSAVDINSLFYRIYILVSDKCLYPYYYLIGLVSIVYTDCLFYQIYIPASAQSSCNALLPQLHPPQLPTSAPSHTTTTPSPPPPSSSRQWNGRLQCQYAEPKRNQIVGSSIITDTAQPRASKTSNTSKEQQTNGSIVIFRSCRSKLILSSNICYATILVSFVTTSSDVTQ